MREILFRGKRLDNGEWVESGSISRMSTDGINWDKQFIGSGGQAYNTYDGSGNLLSTRTESECLLYAIDPGTIGQYTGLTDKNGKKVFEGDILEIHKKEFGFVSLPKIWRGVVEYGNACFCTKDEISHNSPALDIVCAEGTFEVIGNIHDKEKDGDQL